MKNKITFYELLGLIKDNKAPKKVKYENEIYYYTVLSDSSIDYTYVDEETCLRGYLSTIIGNNSISDILTFKLEIISDAEFKEIELLKIKDNALRDERGNYCSLNRHTRIIAHRINDLIENQKKIIEKIEVEKHE